MFHEREFLYLTVRQVHLSSQPQLLSYTPHDSVIPVTLFPHSYALYPFLSPRALPWTMNNSGAFRIRKVGEWLGDSRGEDITATGGLTGERNNICSVDSWVARYCEMSLRGADCCTELESIWRMHSSAIILMLIMAPVFIPES